jgi:hypothetical protein
MKRLMSFAATAAFLTAGILLSCEKEQQRTAEQPAVIEKTTPEPTGNEVIYHASWDEWGRTSKGCKGWGLCNFSDCWGCDPNAAEINTGVVIVNNQTGVGFMYIELNPAHSMEAAAIQQHSVFYVDQDIVNPNSILHHGAFSFQQSIGNYGGYRIPITVTGF